LKPEPTLGARELLDLWSRNESLHPIDAGLAILTAAMPDHDAAALARLSLGQRDALLLAVRRATLGDGLEARDACPTCAAEVELSLSCAELSGSVGTRAGEIPWTVVRDGYCATVRVLTSLDAAAAALAGDVGAARSVLLERAVVRAERDGSPVPAASLPATVVEAISEAIAEKDSGAEITVALECPACGHNWTRLLDVIDFVRTEFADRGRRVLGDIDALARTYGWSEAEILGLEASRRAAYVELVLG
jgi:hypothetical protein